MQPGLDSTPEATRRASTRVVLPPPDGPTSTTFRTAFGPSAVGAAPAPWEALALSAMTFLQFFWLATLRCVRGATAVCLGPPDAVSNFSPNRRPTQGHIVARSGLCARDKRYRGSAGADAACQLDQRRTAIAMTGPFNETDWY